jgi:hypothetical protein
VSLYERWKQAENHTKSIAREGLQRARDSWEDTEQMIRRRMRLFPKQTPPIARPEFQDQSVLRPGSALSRRIEDAERQAMASVKGTTPTRDDEVLDNKKGTAA